MPRMKGAEEFRQTLLNVMQSCNLTVEELTYVLQPKRQNQVKDWLAGKYSPKPPYRDELLARLGAFQEDVKLVKGNNA